MAEYDYTATAGEAVPEDAFSIENFRLGKGETTYDADKIEKESSFHDLEPGNYLLKVTGFGKLELKSYSKFLNGQPANFSAYQLPVFLADTKDAGGRTTVWFTLPPDDKIFLKYYNESGNDKGSTQSIGWFARTFQHFMERLLPGTAYIKNARGTLELTDLAANPMNWKGQKIWAQVEMGNVDKTKTDPATGDPYPARVGVRGFSYRAYTGTDACPYSDDPAKKAAGKPRSGTGGPIVGSAPVVDPVRAMETAGLDCV